MESAFEPARNLIVGSKRDQSGIGTLGEKTLHAVLKYTIEPDDSRHEVKVGPYFADILNESGIIEIQTRNLNILRKKLDYFLNDYPVTIVYPIAKQKWLIWLDHETGEASKRRKSPKTGSPFDAFYELYRIRPQLAHPNLRLRLILLDLVEYRSLDGWSRDRKKGSNCYERIPEKLVGQIDLIESKDYCQLIPGDLPQHFTSGDFARAAGISRRAAQTGLIVLNTVRVVERVGRKGNSIIYKQHIST